jgi:hypothetical protein
MNSGITLEDLASNSQHSCCVYGNIVLTRSLCAPDAAYLKDWSSAILRYGKSQPQGLGALVLIDENAQPPNEAERVAIKDGYLSVRHVVRGVVQVVEGHGFTAAAKRGALTVISLAAGIGIPIKVAGTVTEAALLLAKMLGPAMDRRIDAASLSKAAEELRVRMRLSLSP